MNLDRGAHIATPHSAAKHGQVARPPGSGAESAGETGAPSFLSLLAALDPQFAADGPGDAALPADALADGLSPALPTDAAGLLVAVDGKASDAAHDGLAMGADPAAAGSVVSDLPKGRGVAGGAQPYGGMSARGLQGAEVRELGGTNEPAGHNVQARAGARKGDASRQAREADASLLDNIAAARASDVRQLAERAGAEWRAASATQNTPSALAGASLSELGSAQKAAGGGARSTDRSGPASLSVAGGSALAGSWAEQAMSGGSSAAGPSFAVDAATPSPSTALADKLSYWVSRGVQNAEIQLDAFGGGSVDVSISVNGNEAMVEFRSDQPEARRLLQEAMPQLRDMLRGEGLQLSGGFVGTSSQSDPGAQERRNLASGVRQRMVTMEAVGQAAASAPARTAGRTVDLFV